MLKLVFTPRESAEVPIVVGPVPGVRIKGNTLTDARSGAVLAECHDGHWMFRGKKFYRADCSGPVTINVEGCEPATGSFGPFQHFSLSDGVAYADRKVFAQLHSSNRWYVESAKTECPALFLERSPAS